jgi:two-component system sensor histidine kinase AlgZ
VQYGVEPATDPVLIRISAKRSVDRIEISVINPVLDSTSDGQQSSAGNHMALENIRQRLALLHDVEAQLTTMIENGLFEVRLHLPYVKAQR